MSQGGFPLFLETLITAEKRMTFLAGNGIAENHCLFNPDTGS